jgi:hypothetical protein
MTGIGQHIATGRHGFSSKGEFKVFADLVQQVTLQISNILAELGNLIYAAVCLEVSHELDDSRDQVGTVAVLTGRGKQTQLLVCRRQHLQTLESSHGQSQVPFGVVEALDVGRHVGDGSLGVQGSCADSINAAKDVAQLFLCLCYASHAIGIAFCLSRDHAAHVVIEVILLFM